MNKLTIFFFLFAVFGSIDAFRKVRLGSIPFIELYKGRYTEGITPVPQQYCVEDGAQLCAYYAPDYVKCKNVKYGSGERQTSWRCEAKLANGVRFKMQHISCELYPETDPGEYYVIDGSCALEYTLRRS